MYKMRDRPKSKQTQWGRCHFEIAFTILRCKEIKIYFIKFHFFIHYKLKRNLSCENADGKEN
jgi:hypothetical protein